MAGDWIKMRVWISRDPKVAWMADNLAADPAFRRWLADQFVTPSVTGDVTGDVTRYVTRDVTRVTRYVTVPICVTSLLVIWGTAREQGNRCGDDLVLQNCDTDILDHVCGVPGFGGAMAAVGWLVQQDDRSVRFPKFFCDKASPHERHRSDSAERQAKYRQRKRNEALQSDVTRYVTGDVTGDVTRYVTVTPREEKRREEKNRRQEPPLSPSGGNSDDGVPDPPAGVTAADVRLPPPMDTAEAIAALEEWIAYKRQRRQGYKSISHVQRLVDRFAIDYGDEASKAFVEAVSHSIAQNWSGCFPPSKQAAKASQQQKPRAARSFD